MTYLFVGEERSNLAKRMNYTWRDGRLAAKQLFDALHACGIDPKDCHFVNLFERGGISTVRAFTGQIVAMGNKVQRKLSKMRVEHIRIVHPAARGTIRRKENYLAHIKNALT